MQTDTQSPPQDSVGSQIIYVLKLMRSTVIYNYRYDEAYEVSSWYGVGLLIGTATIISVLLQQLFYYIFLIIVNSSTAGYGFANVLNMLSSATSVIDDPVVWIVALLWDIGITFLFSFLLVLLVGYCIDLFFEVDDSTEAIDEADSDEIEHSQSMWQQFAFAVAIVQAFRLLFAPLTSLIGFLSFGFAFGFEVLSFQFIATVVLSIVAVLLTVYSWIVLYRFIKHRTESQENSIWKYGLVIVFLEGGLILIRLVLLPILAPIYGFIMQSI